MSIDVELQTPPTALVLCTDERMFRFFEIELAHLGLEALGDMHPERPPCMIVADTDVYPVETLLATPLPGDCSIIAFGHEAIALPEGRGVYLRRPFALLDVENALRQLTAGNISTAAPLAVTVTAQPPTETTPTEPLLAVTDEGVTLDGQVLALTPAEIALFRRLYSRRGEVVSREELASLLGGGGNSVEVYICHLRTKIEKPLGRRMIRTVRGQGYVLE